MSRKTRTAGTAALRDEFLEWQCRLRQSAVRQDAGRPSAGMRPQATAETGEQLAAAVTVLIVPARPEQATSLFRHQVLRTLDPVERYHAALEILAADYFQQPREFSDLLTATFGPDSPTADRLLARRRCVLAFAQDDQGYRFPCAVTELDEADPFYQASWWHNRLWDPDVPPRLRVLAFTPDWTRAERISAG